MDYPPALRAKAPTRGSAFVAPPDLTLRGPSWGRKPHRAFLMSFSLGVLLYSLVVLLMVAWMGDIGVRCIFGNEVKERVSRAYRWSDGPPVPGDRILSVATKRVDNYADYIRALRGLSRA